MRIDIKACLDIRLVKSNEFFRIKDTIFKYLIDKNKS